MRHILRAIFILLSVATGALFLYSGYTKLFPTLQSFEYTIVEFVHLPWLLAAIAARFFVGLEFGLGGLIAIHFFGRNKWVLKTAFALLIIFSIYLVYLWAAVGNNVNCGCFGDAIWMSPSASLVKNGILLVVIGLLIRYHNGLNNRFAVVAAPILQACTIVLIFILFSIPFRQPDFLRKDRYKIDFDKVGLSGGATPDILSVASKKDTLIKDSTAAPIDLSKGKHIIAFLSQSCPHCRIAAYKMHLLKHDNPDFPFFMVIGGTSDLTDFWKATKSQDIPYTRLDKDRFLNYTGGVFPLIIWVNDGMVEAKATYNTMTQGSIREWLNATNP